MEQPEPYQINSWRAAEQNAVSWMRYWGFADARLTADGADGGIDVVAGDALAQVKFEAAQVGLPVLQQLLGAARRDVSKQLIFICGAGYSRPAISFANDVDIALFTYDLTGAMKAVNPSAHSVMLRPVELAKREQEERERLERERAVTEEVRTERRAAAEAKASAQGEAKAAAKARRKAEAEARDARKKEEAEAAISRGEMPDDGSKSAMVLIRVIAVIASAVWGWKAFHGQESVSVVWCVWFAVSAVLPGAWVKVWPMVWPAWLGYLTYYYWMAPWPNILRVPVTGVFAILTLLALVVWASLASDYLTVRKRVAEARVLITRQSDGA